MQKVQFVVGCVDFESAVYAKGMHVKGGENDKRYVRVIHVFLSLLSTTFHVLHCDPFHGQKLCESEYWEGGDLSDINFKRNS